MTGGPRGQVWNGAQGESGRLRAGSARQRAWGFAIHGHLCIHRNTRVCLPLFFLPRYVQVMEGSPPETTFPGRVKPSAAWIEPGGMARTLQAISLFASGCWKGSPEAQLVWYPGGRSFFPVFVILHCDLIASGELSLG